MVAPGTVINPGEMNIALRPGDRRNVHPHVVPAGGRAVGGIGEGGDVSWQPSRFGPYNLPPGRTWESFRYLVKVTLGDVVVVDEFVTDSEQVLSDELGLAAADGHDVTVSSRDARVSDVGERLPLLFSRAGGG